MSRIDFLYPAILAVLVLPLAGCGGGSRHDVQEVYYLVAANTKIPYWQAANAGLEAAGRQLQVKYEMVGPDTYDPQAEKAEFRKILGRKPTGILVSAADAAVITPEIDAAVAQGVPVITIDSDAPNSKRLTFIGTNNYEAGRMGGALAAKALNGKGNVVVFTMPEQTNLKERLNGYEQVFRGTGIKIADIVDIKGDPRIAFDTTHEIATKRAAQVDGFICLEALACPEVAEVLNRSKLTGKVVVAMDVDPRTLEWVEKGVIAGTIAQKPFTMAAFGLKMLDDLYHHKPTSLQANFKQDVKAPVPSFVDTGATLVDKNNVAMFLKEAAAQTTQQ
ncbi:MAG TPA: substrate-binding domain-containing protein [Bryobacteraceae bacterium]|nr:substrate-binding domain-containing protein [Bryobacteraceae bacterium]